MQDLKISLVVPVRNEAETIPTLIESIRNQTLAPDEIVIVDGGSTDDTVSIIKSLSVERPVITLIKTDGASPGKGRNLGVKSARNEWIAFTDAGIRLSNNWMERLASASGSNDIVYGNMAPLTDTFFTRCAALAYVAAQNPSGIRGRFIASSLIKRSVWEAVGGFPDLRAAEDLIFMEQAEKAGFRTAFAPDAFVHWQLRPDIASTFAKFILYSKHNVWAGRQWDWHHGILKNYLVLVPFLFVAVFHSAWGLLVLPAWLLARTAKRMFAHHYEFGAATLFNPIIFFSVAFLVILIDLATFIGWAQALIAPPDGHQSTKSEDEGPIDNSAAQGGKP